MTTVSSANELSNQISNTSISYILLEPGTYILTSPLSISRDVILEAGPGTVVLDGEGSTRVLEINSGKVELIGLNITGGYAYTPVSVATTPAHAFGD